MISSRVLAAAALTIAVAAALPAQAKKDDKEPKRPKLDQYADSNDWEAYYQAGASVIRTRPDKAADYFYWAAQLNPSRAEPLYARWAALWMNKPELLSRIWEGAEFAIKSGEAQRIDSLRDMALRRNPFFHRALDLALDAKVYDYQMGAGGWDWTGDPRLQAQFDYGSGRFAQAAAKYAVLVAKNPRSIGLRSDLADALHGARQYDSAATVLAGLVDIMRRTEARRTVSFYQSKTLFLYEIGILKFLQQDYAGAREAYGNALAEDVSFYMGHGALGGIALVQGDTAMAVQEYEQAVQINGADPVLRHDFGAILIAAKRYAEAEENLRASAQMAPRWASPHFMLAVALDAQGKKPDAVQEYRAFVAAAPRAMAAQVEQAKGRLTALGGTAP